MKAIAMLKSGLGYTWAALCIVIVLATFIGMNFWQQSLAEGAGIHVSARFSGGEVRQVIDHGAYETKLHRLVFDGLITDRAEGFVQIDWVPREHQSLPSMIEEDFDIDGDGSNEIGVRVDMIGGKAELLRQASWVIGVDPMIAVDSERILRVRLRNPRSQ
jgi:hypothetical protein